MGMNTVYYRFRHLVGKESYAQKPARLRMQGMVKPKTNKALFELVSLAIAGWPAVKRASRPTKPASSSIS